MEKFWSLDFKVPSVGNIDAEAIMERGGGGDSIFTFHSSRVRTTREDRCSSTRGTLGSDPLRCAADNGSQHHREPPRGLSQGSGYGPFGIVREIEKIGSQCSGIQDTEMLTISSSACAGIPLPRLWIATMVRAREILECFLVAASRPLVGQPGPQGWTRYQPSPRVTFQASKD